MNANASTATASINLYAQPEQDWISATQPHEISQYATETAASNTTENYQLIYSYAQDGDGAVIDYTEVDADEAQFIANSIADAGRGATLNIMSGDFILKTISITPSLQEAATEAFNRSGLSIFLEELNRAAITQ